MRGATQKRDMSITFPFPHINSLSACSSAFIQFHVDAKLKDRPKFALHVEFYQFFNKIQRNNCGVSLLSLA